MLLEEEWVQVPIQTELQISLKLLHSVESNFNQIMHPLK